MSSSTGTAARVVTQMLAVSRTGRGQKKATQPKTWSEMYCQGLGLMARHPHNFLSSKTLLPSGLCIEDYRSLGLRVER